MTNLTVLTFSHKYDQRKLHTSTIYVSVDFTLQEEQDFVLRTAVILKEDRRRPPLMTIREVLARSFGEPHLERLDKTQRTYTYLPKMHPQEVLDAVRPLTTMGLLLVSSVGPLDVDDVLRDEMLAFATAPMMLMAALNLKQPGIGTSIIEDDPPRVKTLCWVFMASQVWGRHFSVLNLAASGLSRDSLRDALYHVMTHPRLKLAWEP